MSESRTGTLAGIADFRSRLRLFSLRNAPPFQMPCPPPGPYWSGHEHWHLRLSRFSHRLNPHDRSARPSLGQPPPTSLNSIGILISPPLHLLIASPASYPRPQGNPASPANPLPSTLSAFWCFPGDTKLHNLFTPFPFTSCAVYNLFTNTHQYPYPNALPTLSQMPPNAIPTMIMRVGNIYARVSAKGYDWNFLGLESANYPLSLCKMTNSKYPLGIIIRTLVLFYGGLRLRYFY